MKNKTENEYRRNINKPDIFYYAANSNIKACRTCNNDKWFY